MTKGEIPMCTSCGLYWDNKTYKLKRPVTGDPEVYLHCGPQIRTETNNFN